MHRASVISAVLIALAAAPAAAGEPDDCGESAAAGEPDDCGEPWHVRLADYVDELCADAADSACRPLYMLVAALDLVMRPEAVDKGSWCCKTCALQEGPAIKCEGCAQGGKSIKCGSTFKFADRPVHLDCPGTSAEAGETVTCL